MPEVLQKAIEMALKGDRAMLKLLLELTMSKAVALEDDTAGKDRVQVTIRRLNIDTDTVNLSDVLPKKEVPVLDSVPVSKHEEIIPNVE